MLLISAHLESGHYFNPHAQRIVEGQQRGAKIAVIDPRLSNTAARADYWLPAWPGTEAAVLLAIAKVMLDEDLFDREFVRRWVNWRTYLAHRAPGDEPTFDELRRRAEGASTRSTRRSSPSARPACPRRRSSQVAREIAARRARRSPRTSGARRPPATSTAGRSPAR